LIDILHTYDVEEVSFPDPSVGDDFLKYALETHRDLNVPGNFLIMGEKLDKIVERNRQDIISLLKETDVGIHTPGDTHPHITKRIENMNWKDGVDESYRFEMGAVTRMESILESPIKAFSKHHCEALDYTPQSVYVAGKEKKVWIYLPVDMEEGSGPVWFAGALCLPMLSTPTKRNDWVEDRNEFSSFTGLDLRWHDEERSREIPKIWDEYLENMQQHQQSFVNFLVGHPCFIVAGLFPAGIFNPNGANLDPSSRRQPNEMIKAGDELQAIYRRYHHTMKDLAERPNLRHLSLDGLQQHYGQQEQDIPAETLLEDVSRMVKQPEVVATGHFSAAEKCVAILRCCLKSEPCITNMTREFVMGPLEVPIVAPEFDDISVEDFLSMAQQALSKVENTEHLPGNLYLKGRRVGINQLYHMGSEYLWSIKNGQKKSALIPVSINRYPSYSAKHSTDSINASRERPQVDPELNLENITRYTRLMCWTLCRAQKRC
jgi:hypothetical protein